MEKQTNVIELFFEPKIDPASLYKSQWKAYYKHGLMNPTIVYGETEREAKQRALAEYRRNSTMMDDFPINMVVACVEYLG